MNAKEIERLKKKLIEMKQHILSSMDNFSHNSLNQSQRDASGDLSGYSFHMADVATDNFDRDFSLRLASNERELLIVINEALQRVEDGTFGACQDCSKNITIKRLRAIPYAKLCLHCQSEQEKGRQ